MKTFPFFHKEIVLIYDLWTTVEPSRVFSVAWNEISLLAHHTLPVPLHLCQFRTPGVAPVPRGKCSCCGCPGTTITGCSCRGGKSHSDLAQPAFQSHPERWSTTFKRNLRCKGWSKVKKTFKLLHLNWVNPLFLCSPPIPLNTHFRCCGRIFWGRQAFGQALTAGVFFPPSKKNTGPQCVVLKSVRARYIPKIKILYADSRTVFFQYI